MHGQQDIYKKAHDISIQRIIFHDYQRNF